MAINKVVFGSEIATDIEERTVYQIDGRSQKVNKVVFGINTIMDITDTTATAGKIASGYTAYGADGVKVVGTLEQEITNITVSEGTVEGTALILTVT